MIKELLLVAVHPHCGVVVMDILPAPPAEDTADGDEKVKSQVAITDQNASSFPPPNVA